MSPRALARLQLVAAAVLFSTGGAAIKSAAFTPVQVAGLRSGVAALAVFLLVPAARRNWSWHPWLLGIAYAATLILFVLANRLTTAANTIFLQSAAPLYILLLGPLLLKEPVRRRDLGFMAVVGVGLALFFVGAEAPAATAPDPARGNLLAALSGVTWALTICGLRWLGAHPGESTRDGSAGVRAVVAGNAIAFFACLPWILPLGSHGAVDWATILYLGIFQIGLAYVCMTSGLRRVPALEASVLLLVEPALNPIWAWLVHGERPGAWAVAGGALILGATIVKTWRDSTRLDPAARAEVHA